MNEQRINGNYGWKCGQEEKRNRENKENGEKRKQIIFWNSSPSTK